MPIRSAVFFDGFNMYHSLLELDRPHLKWLDLWSVSESLLSKDETLVGVTHCTAIRTDDVDRMLRHRAYLAALESRGVVCLKGNFADEYGDCHECGHRWSKPVEKQGDVNLAIAIIDGAHKDAFDKCYLVTADSDQAATARLFRERFDKKTIVSVAPPGRHHSKAILAHAHGKCGIEAGKLQLHLFAKTVKCGPKLVIRPASYDPPEEKV